MISGGTKVPDGDSYRSRPVSDSRPPAGRSELDSTLEQLMQRPVLSETRRGTPQALSVNLQLSLDRVG
jgi:hypothetical protein